MAYSSLPLPRKFLPGSSLLDRSQVFNKHSILPYRPDPFSLPTSKDHRDVTDLPSKSKLVDSKKKVVSKKRSLHDSSSPTTIEKNKTMQKIKKSMKPEDVPTAPPVATAATEVVPQALSTETSISQGSTHLEGTLDAPTLDLEPIKDMTDDPRFREIEGICESTTPLDPITTTPNRAPTPIQNPSPDRASNRVRDPASPQVPLHVENLNRTVEPTTVWSPSRHIINDTLLEVQI